ncbi:MAG: cupin domain-containing protein, partial [bacterium]|nr:cupin domain-containing protein [bacterium]
HPDQEEVIYVVSGTVEQWVDREKRILGPGDSAHIPADMVHASFNVGDDEAKVTAILGPCVGENGYELVDVADEAPWKTLRD